MTIIAVGIAIIPKLDQKLYEENRKIFDKNRGFYFKDEQVPHITLMQSFVKQDMLDDICCQLENLELNELFNITHFMTKSIELVTGYSHLTFTSPHELKKAHIKVMDSIKNIGLDVEPSIEAFSSQVDEQELRTVKEYAVNASYENFHPHITLGKGSTKTKSLNDIKIYPHYIALGKLGAHCTMSKEVIWKKTWPANPGEQKKADRKETA